MVDSRADWAFYRGLPLRDADDPGHKAEPGGRCCPDLDALVADAGLARVDTGDRARGACCDARRGPAVELVTVGHDDAQVLVGALFRFRPGWQADNIR